MIVDKFSKPKGRDQATVIEDDGHVLTNHRPCRRRLGKPSHATPNTDPSIGGDTGTSVTGITDVTLTKAPKFGGAPTRGPRPDNDAKSRARCLLDARLAKTRVHE